MLASPLPSPLSYVSKAVACRVTLDRQTLGSDIRQRAERESEQQRESELVLSLKADHARSALL
jgi:hypothetical protein